MADTLRALAGAAFRTADVISALHKPLAPEERVLDRYVFLPHARAGIAAALDSLPEGRTPTRDDWSRLSTAWRDDLDRRIEQLTLLRDGLTDCIGCGCLSLKACALLNPDDALAETGPGPRRLEDVAEFAEGDDETA